MKKSALAAGITERKYRHFWHGNQGDWWQQWLGGVDTGIMAEPMLRVYMIYQADSQAFPAEVPGRWVAENVWPPSRKHDQSLYFDATSRLSATPGAHDSVKYVGDKIVGLNKPQWVYGRPTEFEQSPDDGLSLVFDSAALEQGLEILGSPVAKMRVAANVPVAQLAVPLTEVTPAGQSWLLSYNLLNLTHRDSLGAPRALESGQFYDVSVPLYMIAHRFSRGSRIRVAISSGLWPLAWPSPENATLDIALGASSLVLPVRPIPTKEAPFTIPVIHADSGGYANGLNCVKTPLATTNQAPRPVREARGRITYNLREWVIAKKGEQEVFRRSE